MNNVVLVGRITKDPELKYLPSGKANIKFTLAVDRAFSKDKATDFINCVAWDKTAEIIATYAPKGKQIAVSGRIQTGKYENQDGRTIYTTDVIVNEMQLLGSAEQKPNTEAYSDLTPVDDGDIPF